jgi:hypothetical protein
MERELFCGVREVVSIMNKLKAVMAKKKRTRAVENFLFFCHAIL